MLALLLTVFVAGHAVSCASDDGSASESACESDDVSMLQVTKGQASLQVAGTAELEKSLQRVRDVALEDSQQMHDMGVLGHNFAEFMAKINGPLGLGAIQAAVDDMDSQATNIDNEADQIVNNIDGDSSIDALTDSTTHALTETKRIVGSVHEDLVSLHTQLTDSVLQRLGVTNQVVDVIERIQSWCQCFLNLDMQDLEDSESLLSTQGETSLLQDSLRSVIGRQQLSADSIASIQRHISLIGDTFEDLHACWCQTGTGCEQICVDYEHSLILGPLVKISQDTCNHMKSSC